ncbi:MAG: hypothetical protein BGP13_11435 [Sphingobacteriales bacterium 40-81]|nr:MAG: hypothetical protein BGP13_11435 [Sphingobacteriales bacterium 40-81]
MVKFLLDNGAHDPEYKFYPLQESLQTVANDRKYFQIENMLNEYDANKSRHKYKGDNGRIFYNITVLQNEFEKSS